MIYIDNFSYLSYVNPLDVQDLRFLYRVLEERNDKVNISHKGMPTWEEHCFFVKNNPYYVWFIMRRNGVSIASVYLTTTENLSGRAIGIFVLKEFQNSGYGKKILDAIKNAFPNTRLLANVSPSNEVSQAFFEKNGFKKIQYTYEYQG